MLAYIAPTSRPRTEGPLATGHAGAIVDAFSAGEIVTYGMQTLGNESSGSSIELISVSVRMGEPAVTLVGDPALLGRERVEAMGAGVFDVLPGWPPFDTIELLPPAGALLSPGSRSEYEVVVPLRVPDLDPGIGIITGFTVEYDVDGRRYREDTDMVLVICPTEDHVACDEFDPGRDI